MENQIGVLITRTICRKNLTNVWLVSCSVQSKRTIFKHMLTCEVMGWNSQDRSQFDRRQSRSEADKLQHLESTLVIIDWVDFASKCKATIPWIHFSIGIVYVEFIEEENDECFSKDSENQLQHRGALSRSEKKQMNRVKTGKAYLCDCKCRRWR